jgi:hypothetical protein
VIIEEGTAAIGDVEDIGGRPSMSPAGTVRATCTKRKRQTDDQIPVNNGQDWREALGPPPQRGTTEV